ncbi:CvfB family protein [Fusibacter tunisiensis]|uniref:RNA-binding protein (Virulence factor B family) n=1 Tax=Fusibacter tunisiensis TaxID=1008308 RepID=A0ABS2MSA6_9FIRM|nr:S1-like domain-containing RNA-binding protein [Fusibacter tunisiensis]MBM7562278.1 putative RNA-binding protein (virulence factor B family) [Fusibacter tunisiensis]
MIQIGKIQKLYVNRISNYGIFLSDEINGENEILLPAKGIDQNLKQDSEISVFVYKDIEQGIVATTSVPKLQLGEIGMLPVTGSIKSGTFLDMGVGQDLFMPFNETKGNPQKGQKCLVRIEIDSEQKLFGTMKIYNHLTVQENMKVGDHVKGTVYELSNEMGAFVAVENQFHGMIPKHEIYKEIKEGAQITARITKIREDGKINLSIRERAQIQINDDVQLILDALESSEGILYLNDDTPPEIIKKRLNISKRAFKRAVGKLLKEGKIELFEDGIRLIS